MLESSIWELKEAIEKNTVIGNVLADIARRNFEAILKGQKCNRQYLQYCRMKAISEASRGLRRQK